MKPFNEIFVIAEIGINHNGSVEIAKQLIDLAVQSGCDAVKFQKRTISTVYSEEVLSSPRESPWGKTTREQKEGLEFSERDYNEIDSYCKSLKIEWFASAWDIESQYFLRKYECRYNKIASAMLTNLAFLEVVASERKFTFVSTGMSDLEAISKAVEIFQRFDCPIMLMHTVSIYPCAEDKLNLMAIKTLYDRFKIPVGYSGHESTLAPSIIAAALGAAAIERHITLDRAMYGSDQAASLAPRGLQELVSQLRRFPKMLGDGQIKIEDGEEAVAQKLRYWLEVSK